MAEINLGAIKFNWKGAYAGGTAYVVDDVVSYQGSSYVCILASTGNLPTDTTYWNVMAEGGDVATVLTTQGDILYRDGSGLQRLGAGTSGDFLKTQGTGANPVWASAGGGLQSMQVFTSSGTYTKPSGINLIKIYVTGGGGSGADGAGNYNTGGGGGGGATAIKIIDATSITTETVTIGNGATGASQSNGSSGGTSSFGSHASATGGGGGVQENNGGDGGTATGGDINLRGSAGGSGGGGGTGDEAPGNAYGGSTFWGLGGAGAHNLTSGRINAIVYGTGGGGGDHDGTSYSGGGDGMSGIVVVEEYK